MLERVHIGRGLSTCWLSKPEVGAESCWYLKNSKSILWVKQPMCALGYFLDGYPLILTTVDEPRALSRRLALA
jgi:hypothetical protein